MFSNGLFVFLFMIVSAPVGWSQNSGQSVPASSNAAAQSETNDLFFLCKREKSVRWLRAYKLDNGKCKTLYSKEGYMQVVSSATYFASCEGVLQSVRKNIEEGGFKCIQTPQISFLDLDNS